MFFIAIKMIWSLHMGSIQILWRIVGTSFISFSIWVRCRLGKLAFFQSGIDWCDLNMSSIVQVFS